MKFLPLVWAGIWRKPTRAVLLLLSVISAFLLFGLLQGLSSGLDRAQSQAHADVLLTFSRVSQLDPLPLGHLASIRTIPGVRAVSPILSLDGLYGDPGEYVGAFGVDTRQIPATIPAMSISGHDLRLLQNTRTGAVISTALAANYRWKVGDRIPIRSTVWANEDGSNVWPLDVVGVFTSNNSVLLSNSIIYNYDYVDKGRVKENGTVTGFLVRIADADHASAIANRIDALFANSRNETKTSTEQQLALDQVKRIGDVGFIVSIVVGTVFASLLFSLSIVLMLSIRERSSELAILKTLGFTDGGVLALILTEIGSFCVIAAVCGLAMASVVFPYAKRGLGFAAVQHGPVFAVGIALAVAVALGSGLPAAIRAMRLNLVDALAGR